MANIGTEIKFTLPADQVAAGLNAFGLADRVGERRDVYFVEALDPGGSLRFYDHDLVVRVRRRADDSGDVTVKLRPVDRDRLTGRWRPGTEHDKAEYKVEIDWARKEKQVLAASVTVKHDSGIARRLDGPRKKLLIDEQEHFLRNCGPDLNRPFLRAVNAGPIIAHKWDDVAVSGCEGVRAEQWSWGAGKKFLELSLRCDPDEDAAAARASLAFELEHLGLKPDDAATTKTEVVLRDFLRPPRN
jgi:hypothetical protein